MAALSARTLLMAVQAVDAEIRRLQASVGGEIARLEPDDQETLLAYSQAAMELKTAYTDARRANPGMPPYEQLGGTDSGAGS
jgi:hypothetical protein